MNIETVLYCNCIYYVNCCKQDNGKTSITGGSVRSKFEAEWEGQSITRFEIHTTVLLVDE